MGNTPNIKSFKRIRPMIYAYQTPAVPAHNGWTKIGYTATQSVADRINQQSHTINVPAVLRWTEPAMYLDGSFETFTDHDVHRVISLSEIEFWINALSSRHSYQIKKTVARLFL